MSRDPSRARPGLQQPRPPLFSGLLHLMLSRGQAPCSLPGSATIRRERPPLASAQEAAERAELGPGGGGAASTDPHPAGGGGTRAVLLTWTARCPRPPSRAPGSTAASQKRHWRWRTAQRQTPRGWACSRSNTRAGTGAQHSLPGSHSLRELRSRSSGPQMLRTREGAGARGGRKELCRGSSERWAAVLTQRRGLSGPSWPEAGPPWLGMWDSGQFSPWAPAQAGTRHWHFAGNWVPGSYVGDESRMSMNHG